MVARLAAHFIGHRSDAFRFDDGTSHGGLPLEWRSRVSRDGCSECVSSALLAPPARAGPIKKRSGGDGFARIEDAPLLDACTRGHVAGFRPAMRTDRPRISPTHC